ncbi:MAG: Ig-like domain-containing protein, partial [Bacteroidales bacterium]
PVGGAKSNFQVFVNDEKGQPAGAGIAVSWSAFPANLIEFDAISGLTDATGIAETQVAGRVKGSGTITPVVGGVRGNPVAFHVGENAVMTFTIAPNPANTGDEITVSGTMKDTAGEALIGDNVSFTSDPPGLDFADATTNALGEFESKLIPVVNGDYDITALSTGFNLSKTVGLVIN